MWQYHKAATEVPQSLTSSDSNDGNSGNYCGSSMQYNCCRSVRAVQKVVNLCRHVIAGYCMPVDEQTEYF